MTKNVKMAFGAITLITALLGASNIAVAQGGYMPPAKRVPPGVASAKLTSDLPTPRRADGHPDLTGVWGGTPPGKGTFVGLRRQGTFEADQGTSQRASEWNKPIYKPEFWKKVRSLDYSRVDVDPAYNCTEPGVPRQNAPNRIIQFDTYVMIFNGGNFRVVPTDGKPHTDLEKDQLSDNGVPRAHWDGDTLIVESVGFSGNSWIQWTGYFHTDALKVTERLWRKGNFLYYNWTVDDPNVLVEPWTQDTMIHVLNTAPVQATIPGTPCEITGIPIGNPYLRG